MLILANFKFFKLVIDKRNKMLLRIFVKLTKYISCFTIRRINLYAKRSTSIEVF